MRFSNTRPSALPLRDHAAQQAPRRLFGVLDAPAEVPEDELRFVPHELPQDLDQRVRAIGEW